MKWLTRPFQARASNHILLRLPVDVLFLPETRNLGTAIKRPNQPFQRAGDWLYDLAVLDMANSAMEKGRLWDHHETAGSAVSEVGPIWDLPNRRDADTDWRPTYWEPAESCNKKEFIRSLKVRDPTPRDPLQSEARILGSHKFGQYWKDPSVHSPFGAYRSGAHRFWTWRLEAFRYGQHKMNLSGHSAVWAHSPTMA